MLSSASPHPLTAYLKNLPLLIPPRPRLQNAIACALRFAHPLNSMRKLLLEYGILGRIADALERFPQNTQIMVRAFSRAFHPKTCNSPDCSHNDQQHSLVNRHIHSLSAGLRRRAHCGADERLWLRCGRGGCDNGSNARWEATCEGGPHFALGTGCVLDLITDWDNVPAPAVLRIRGPVGQRRGR
jgi:hypothetical protein